MNEEKNWILITTKGTYAWSSETQTFYSGPSSGCDRKPFDMMFSI